MNIAKYCKNSRGMSIVELLVVMVVLLIGIGSIVSMFPGGFRAVRHAESMTFADRLAQGEMERWKNNIENLPYGVVPISISGGTVTVLNDQNPNPSINDAKATNIRRVLGETTKVPMGTPFSTNQDGSIEYASMYTLAYAPIEYDTVDDLVITGGDLQRREMDSGDNDAGYHLRNHQYGIDYSSATGSEFKMCFPRRGVDAVYYVTYSYWVQGTSEMELMSSVDQIVNVPADSSGTWISVPIYIPDSTTLDGIEDSSDTVARGFVNIGNNPFDTSDPYEFRLADQAVGIVAFNPYGHNAVERTSRGMQPLEAHINYNIYDLTIMRDDRRVDESGRVKLSLKYIMKYGEPVASPLPGRGNTCEALPGTSGLPVRDIMVIDLATGAKLPLDAPGSGPTGADIDYDNGVITFDPGYAFMAGGQEYVLESRNIRILYRADGDWSLQLQKAYELYRRDIGTRYGTSTPPGVDYRTYTAHSGNGVLTGRLSFAPCDAGKTVSVDYAYMDPQGVEHKVVGECHQISETESAFGAITACRVQLDFNNTKKFGANAANNQMTRIYSVVGVSLKVRVLWREGTRWRYVDKDTTLMRKSSEV